jgi:NAD(P)H-flavin reductase
VTTINGARLQISWGLVAQYGDQVPLFFYSRLFVSHPHVRDMFPLGMASQRDKLVTALGTVVSHVDDLPTVVPVLQQLGRDHRRFAVMRDHYPAVGEALLATLEHFLGDEWSDELAADWAAAYNIVAGVMIEAAEADGHRPAWYEASVAGLERRTASIAVIRLQPTEPIPYRAGQSLSMEVSSRPRLWRYYSPATLPAADGSFEIHVRSIGGGAVSTALVQATRVGDVVRFGSPVGDGLVLDDESGRDLVLIAGGTGVAPMKAILQQLDQVGDRRVVRLFWGGRRHFDLYDLLALQHLTRHDWAQLVPCVSEEPSAAGASEQGSAVEVALRHGGLAGPDVYVCGSPAMVNGTIAALGASGVPADRIHYERFGLDGKAGGA